MCLLDLYSIALLENPLASRPMYRTVESGGEMRYNSFFMGEWFICCNEVCLQLCFDKTLAARLRAKMFWLTFDMTPH